MRVMEGQLCLQSHAALIYRLLEDRAGTVAEN